MNETLHEALARGGYTSAPAPEGAQGRRIIAPDGRDLGVMDATHAWAMLRGAGVVQAARLPGGGGYAVEFDAAGWWRCPTCARQVRDERTREEVQRSPSCARCVVRGTALAPIGVSGRLAEVL